MRIDEQAGQDLYNRQIGQYAEACEGIIDVLELQEMMRILKEFDLLHGNIVETGAGSGQLTKLILREKGDFTILATEQCQGLLNELATTTSDDRLMIQQNSFYCLNVEVGGFDLVVSNFAYNHAADLDGAMREAARVLKEGGYLLFSSVIANQSNDQPRQLHGKLDTAAGEIDVFAYQYDEDQIRELLKNAGFSVISFEKFSPPYWSIDPCYIKEGITAQTFVCLAVKIL